jgi:predicted DNA-binding transcriptional regulator YafY
MGKSNDISVIKWQMRMLELIPAGREARGITVEQLRAKLDQLQDPDEGDGKDATRKIQRTLKAISEDPEWGAHLLCRIEGASGMVEADPDPQNRRKKQYWKWSNPNKRLLLPGLGVDEALTLLLVQERLATEMPPATRECLEPYFEAARRRIDQTGPGSPHAKWLRKVVSRPPNQPLLPARINPKVQDTVLAALNDEMQLEIRYRARGKGSPANYTVHPLGIIMRGPVTYLVCTINSHTDPRLLALHRISSAFITDAKASTSGFSLKKYLAEGGADFCYGQTIKLDALFDFEVGEHLESNETQLTSDQTLEMVGDRYRLQATVPDTQQLRWWLIGFGPRVEVVKPVALREWIANEHRTAARQYGKPG